MPPESHTPMRRIRMLSELWDDFGVAAKAAGTDRSVLVRAFVGWYLGRPGVKLPRRPKPPPATE